MVYLSTNSRPAAVILSLLPTSCALIAANSMLLANSRTLWAFARNGAFVFPAYFKVVDRKNQVPVRALVACAAVESVMVVLYLGSNVLFYTITSLATIGFDLYVKPSDI